MRLASAVCEALLAGEAFDPVTNVVKAKAEALARRWKRLAIAYLYADRRARAIAWAKCRALLVQCRWSRLVRYLQVQQFLIN